MYLNSLKLEIGASMIKQNLYHLFLFICIETTLRSNQYKILHLDKYLY